MDEGKRLVKETQWIVMQQKIDAEKQKSVAEERKTPKKWQLLALSVLTLIVGLWGISRDYTAYQYEAQLQKVSASKHQATEYLIPVTYSPYTVEHPEDNCGKGFITEISGYYGCI